jgi:hypothetical protein
MRVSLKSLFSGDWDASVDLSASAEQKSSLHLDDQGAVEGGLFLSQSVCR